MNGKKLEEEEDWDPDFEEFDIPKSKVKKAAGGATGGKKAGKEEDDFSFEDDEFKDMDLFNDRGLTMTKMIFKKQRLHCDSCFFSRYWFSRNTNCKC